MTTGYKPSNKSKLISKSKSTKYYKNISNTYNKLSKNQKIKYIQFKFHNVPCYWLNNTQYLNNVKFNITSTNSSRYYFNKIINIKKKQFFINYLFTFTVNYKHTQTNFIPFMFYKMWNNTVKINAYPKLIIDTIKKNKINKYKFPLPNTYDNFKQSNQHIYFIKNLKTSYKTNINQNLLTNILKKMFLNKLFFSKNEYIAYPNVTKQFYYNTYNNSFVFTPHSTRLNFLQNRILLNFKNFSKKSIKKIYKNTYVYNKFRKNQFLNFFLCKKNLSKVYNNTYFYLKNKKIYFYIYQTLNLFQNKLKIKKTPISFNFIKIETLNNNIKFKLNRLNFRLTRTTTINNNKYTNLLKNYNKSTKSILTSSAVFLSKTSYLNNLKLENKELIVSDNNKIYQNLKIIPFNKLNLLNLSVRILLKNKSHLLLNKSQEVNNPSQNRQNRTNSKLYSKLNQINMWNFYSKQLNTLYFNKSTKNQIFSSNQQTTNLYWLKNTLFSQINNIYRLKKLNDLPLLVNKKPVIFWKPEYYCRSLTNKLINSFHFYLFFLKNPVFFKIFFLNKIACNTQLHLLSSNNFGYMYNIKPKNIGLRNTQVYTNIIPNVQFNYTILKKIYTSLGTKKFSLNVIPFYSTTVIRFMEHVSGHKILLNFYPFINQSITTYWIVKYKLWLPRLSFYESKLGHKFFLEESIHILHLSFFLKDAKLLLSWLKTIILRISFWKTRSIFRFIKYLMLNFFIQIFPTLQVKGFRVKLKGKISSAGNSRKKSILYRFGETSHSKINLRIVNETDTVITFTGVMGLNVSIFY